MSSPSRRSTADTPTALLDASEALLASEKNFSMGGVARLAGVSRQTVYLHFEDRYALLDALVRRAIADSGAEAAKATIAEVDTALEALDVLVDTMVALAVRHGPLERAVRAVISSDAELAARWSTRPGRGEVMAAMVKRLAGEGQLREGLGVPQAAALLRTLTGGEVCLGLLGQLAERDACAMLRRAVRAALLP